MKTAPIKRPKLVATVETVKAALGRTWFDVSDEGSNIEISTRDNGDVGSERAGDADRKEGQRLLALLRKTFKPANWISDYEVIDEWVHVNLRKLPRTKQEKDAIKAAKAQEAADARVRQLVAEAEDALPNPHGEGGEALSFMSPSKFSSHKGIIEVRYGERILYIRPGTRFKLKTPEEAIAVGEALCTKLGGKWLQGKPHGPLENKTANYRPPNNVIERYGLVQFTRTSL